MASSNFPKTTPTAATAKHQPPVGQRNINYVFPDLLCFKKSLLELVLCIEASEKPPHGQVGAENSGCPPDSAQGWGQCEAHPNLLFPKNSWWSSHPYPQVNPK